MKVNLGKTFPVKANPVLTQLARLRLALGDELRSSGPSKEAWSLQALKITDQMITQEALLSGKLEGDVVPLKMKDHVKALKEQWVLRQNAYAKTSVKFIQVLDVYHHNKRSWTARLTLLFDRS